jgi:hypothetical protein
MWKFYRKDVPGGEICVETFQVTNYKDCQNKGDGDTSDREITSMISLNYFIDLASDDSKLLGGLLDDADERLIRQKVTELYVLFPRETTWRFRPSWPKTCSKGLVAVNDTNSVNRPVPRPGPTTSLCLDQAWVRTALRTVKLVPNLVNSI